MKCQECGNEFPANNPEEEICPRCQIEAHPERDRLLAANECPECLTPLGMGSCDGCCAVACNDMGDNYEPECCPHCGKEYEDFSDLGCEACDARYPDFEELGAGDA